MPAMERFGTGRLIVVIGLNLMLYDKLVTTSGIDDHHNYSDDVINAARCRVRCLSHFQVFVAFVVAAYGNISRKALATLATSRRSPKTASRQCGRGLTVTMTNSAYYILPT